MRLLKSVILAVLVCGVVFAQAKISPVISMSWDYEVASNVDTIAVSQRIGVQSSIDGDRWYGIDTDGKDHRTFFGWKYAKLGIGIDGGDTYYTIGATYALAGSMRSEVEYVQQSDKSAIIRISLVAAF